MTSQRYWGLFWIALAMAAHSAIVGRVLGSSFFIMLFFWGWVAAAAYRGQLTAARSMSVTMVILLAVISVAVAFVPSESRIELAYYTFALYPALVSWTCVYFYVRHLQQKDMRGVLLPRRTGPQRRAV